jgi:glycosyltransferase involved in cell wall biosynthesis
MSEQRTGQGRHIEFVAQQWSRMKIPFDRVVLMSPRELHLDQVGNMTPVELVHFHGDAAPIVWEQYHLARRARGAALLFCPSYTCPLLYDGKLVLANHGIYEALPQEFPWLARWRATIVQRYSARRADRVIANSQSTKSDVERFFGISPHKINIIYPAAHEFYFHRHSSAEVDSEVERVFGKRVPYVIFVGKLAKRRHVPNLIEAFARVRQQHHLAHHLLIVGPNTAQVPVAELARSHGVGDAVLYLPYAELEPLARLYAGADVYALPTIYEGISQTMFEAMASGVAVLTVEHPTLAEGAGDAALAMPTPSVEDLARGLVLLLTNQDVRKSYANKGRERSRLFSWENVARETMLILDRVAYQTDRS